jgi:ComF family protein
MQKRYKCIRTIQNWLFPSSCLLCGAPGEDNRDLCAACRRSLPWRGAACARCAAPLAQIEAAVCGRCLRAPPAFDASLIPLHYRTPLDWLIQGFKFNQKLPAGRLLGQLLAEHLAQRIERPPELILPVPLHPQRLRERGYNQSLMLAKPIARRLGVPLEPGLIVRQRATASQSLLSADERRRNVRGAFAIIQPLRVHHIAIVDDVVTTGSTVNELARELRRAGAKRIEIWALASA